MPNKITPEYFDRDYFDGTKEVTPYKHGYHSERERNIARQRFLLLDPLVREREKENNGTATALLELGCATGAYLSQYEDRKMELYGVDISEYAIQQAKQRVKRGQFYRLNLEKEPFPFPDGAFDIVTAYTILEHLFEPEKALREIERVTKEGAYLYVVVPVIPLLFISESLNRWVFWSAQRLLGLLGKSLLHDKSHVSIFHKKEWFRMFSRRNFSVVKNFTAEGFVAPVFDRLPEGMRRRALSAFPESALSMHIILRKEKRSPGKLIIPKLKAVTHYKRFTETEPTIHEKI
ncbi:MAG: class I SAM-dependent methyltransferase [Candidatus Omnitrophica bacterium]|nr:class I SAM-dependent methyltransferase [Candidatus Omnitrophota bacterium]